MSTRKTSVNNGSRRRLVVSVVSMLLCVAMLVGTSFAWFSDSASTAVNKVVAGNLDVELQYGKPLSGPAAGLQWNNVEDEPKIDVFSQNEGDGVDNSRWEPGMVVVSYPLRVVNKGSVWLKYEMSLNVVNETKSDNDKSLSDVIKVGYLTSDALSEASKSASSDLNDVEMRQLYIDAVNNNEEHPGFQNISDWAIDATLGTVENGNEGLPEDTDWFYLLLYWEPGTFEEDNLYNGLNTESGTAPSITFGVNVKATQVDHESDSFGDKYDAGILFDHETVKKVEELDEEKADEYDFRIGDGRDVLDDPDNSYRKTGGGSKDPWLLFNKDGRKNTLLKDLTISGKTDSPLRSGDDLQFDLNNKVMAGYFSDVTFPSGGGRADLSIKNGVIESDGSEAAFSVYGGGGKLTFEDVIFRGKFGSADHLLSIMGKPLDATLRKCTVEDSSAITGTASSDPSHRGKALIEYSTFLRNASIGCGIDFTIRHSTFKNSNPFVPNKEYGLKVYRGTQSTKGEIESSQIDSLYILDTNPYNGQSFDLTIKNSTIGDLYIDSTNSSKTPKMNFTLEDVTVTGELGLSTSRALSYIKLKIVSGKYSFDPAGHLAAGSTVEKKGNFWIVTVGK